MPIALNDLDLRLLDAIQRDASASNDMLAERLTTSRSAVQRRLRRMREAGLIDAEITVLNSNRLPTSMTFIVEVELVQERIDLLDEFRRSMQRIDAVQQCYYVTGRGDFVLIVTAPDMKAFEALTRRVFTENPNIRRFATSVVVDTVKVGLFRPMEQDSEETSATL